MFLFDISITLGVSCSFTLLCTVLHEEACGLSTGGKYLKSWSCYCVSETFVYLYLAGNTLTSAAVSDPKFSQTCLSHCVVHDRHLIRSVTPRVTSSQTTATVTVGRWRSVAPCWEMSMVIAGQRVPIRQSPPTCVEAKCVAPHPGR